MNSRSGLLSTLSAFLLFLVLASLSILLVVENGVVQRFRIMGTVRDIQAWGWTRTNSIATYFNFRTENERLVAENLRLQQQLARYQAAERELDSAARYVEPDFSYISAAIIKNTVDRQHNHLVIDRGREEGVEPGLGVVTANGVIGIVGAVGDHYAYVISILGAGQTVSAKLAASGAFGPMTWPGSRPDRMILHEIPVHIQAAEGDTVLTSGYSTIYPPDIPLGSVVSAKVSQGSSQELTIALFEDFRTLHTVYVVRNNHQAEIEELYEQVP
jgi:rod shape-determining protein MreC